jgi:hypothetical protein
VDGDGDEAVWLPNILPSPRGDDLELVAADAHHAPSGSSVPNSRRPSRVHHRDRAARCRPLRQAAALVLTSSTGS